MSSFPGDLPSQGWPPLPAWCQLHAFDRRIRSPELSLTMLHLQPENAHPLLLARIREEALRQTWSERNARILTAPPILVEDGDAPHEALQTAALVQSVIAPGWARVLAGIQGGAAWAVVETLRSTAVALAWIGPLEPLAAAQDAADAQAALRTVALFPDLQIPLVPHLRASAHDRLHAAAALLPDGGGLEIRQAQVCAPSFFSTEKDIPTPPPPDGRAHIPLPMTRLAALTLLLLLLTATGRAEAGWGSGTVVGIRGEILTAAHVVHSCGAIQVITADGRRAAARIEGLDPVGDLALLRASFIGGTPPRLREGIARGDTVHVHGFPVAAEGRPIFSSSRVARLSGPRGEPDALTLDGRITIGESGAGVFDAHGNLVGLAYSAAESRWYAVGAARIAEFLLTHGVPVSAGAAVGSPSLSQISAYLRLVSVHVRCWTNQPPPPLPPEAPRR